MGFKFSSSTRSIIRTEIAIHSFTTYAGLSDTCARDVGVVLKTAIAYHQNPEVLVDFCPYEIAVVFTNVKKLRLDYLQLPCIHHKTPLPTLVGPVHSYIKRESSKLAISHRRPLPRLPTSPPPPERLKSPLA